MKRLQTLLGFGVEDAPESWRMTRGEGIAALVLGFAFVVALMVVWGWQ